MYNLSKFNIKKTYLSQFVNWGKIIPPGIIINKDGSLMAIIEFRGPDLDSEIPEKLSVLTTQLNDMFMQFDSGYVLYFEANRQRSTDYDHDVFFPDAVTKAIDDERAEVFSKGSNFESRYYFSLYYMPPADREEKLKSMMMDNQNKRPALAEDYINAFINKVESVLNGLQAFGIPYVKWLECDEIATYLHQCISNKRHPIHLPDKQNQALSSDEKIDLLDDPLLLDNLLYDTPLVGGFEPRLGNEWIKVIVPLGFTPTSYFGMFNQLNLLNFEYRWVSRYFCMNKQDCQSELEGRNKAWKGKVKPLLKTIRELIMGHPDIDGSVNEHALSKVEEIKNAKFAVENDDVLYGLYSTMIVIKNKNKDKADRCAQSVKQILLNMGIQAKIEDVNTLDSFLGSMPGNVYNQVRRPIISTLNLIHMMPLTNIWAGQKRNQHFNAPPLLYTKTIGSTPFRLDLYIGDVGHTMMFGPTGAGKSVHLCMMAAQFRKYKDAQVFIFDKGASSRILTLAVGGNFFDLGSEDDSCVSFQPLANIDSEKERLWVQEWLTDFLVSQNVKVTVEDKKYIWETLSDMTAYKKQQRTMSLFTMTLPDNKLREALEILTKGHTYGKFFDSSEENLSFSNSWQVFEMEKLLQFKSIVGTTLMYIFHRLEESLDGRPTIIILDECWTFFDNPQFASKIREWLKVLRKYNASVIFATQTLSDIKNNDAILTTILDSCKSRIFLPNDKVFKGENKELYKSMGLNDRQLQIISSAIPKRQYYYDSPLGCRLYDLALSKKALSYVGISKKDQIECNRILAQYGTKDFVKHWSEYKGV